MTLDENENLATGAALQARIEQLESNEREYERIVGRKSYQEVADEIAQAQERVRMLEEEVELLRMQLTACGVASLQNTLESAAQRIQRSNPYWTASYGDVCAAVDREMSLRATLAAAIEQHSWPAAPDNAAVRDSIGRENATGDGLLRSPAPAAPLTAQWKLMPKEPTLAMISAGAHVAIPNSVDIYRAMWDAAPEEHDSDSPLRALLEGLECKEIDRALRERPEFLRQVGMEIATAAKLGAHLYARKPQEGK